MIGFSSILLVETRTTFAIYTIVIEWLVMENTYILFVHLLHNVFWLKHARNPHNSSDSHWFVYYVVGFCCCTAVSLFETVVCTLNKLSLIGYNRWGRGSYTGQALSLSIWWKLFVFVVLKLNELKMNNLLYVSSTSI